MPAKKTASGKSATKKSASSKSTTSKTAKENSRPAANEKTGGSACENTRKGGDPGKMIHQIMPYLLVLFAIFTVISYLIPDSDSTGAVGGFLKNTFFGLFAGGGWAIPFALLNIAFFYRRDVESGFIGYKVVFSFAFVSFLSVLINAFARNGEAALTETFKASELFENGRALMGGGVIGGFLGNLFLRGFGFVGTVILTIALMLLFAIFMFGLTPHMLVVYIITGIREWKDGLQDRMEDAREERTRVLNEYEARRAAVREARAAEAAKNPKRGVIEPLENAAAAKNFYDAAEDDDELSDEVIAKGKKAKDEAVPETLDDEPSEADEAPFEVEATSKRTGRLRREKIAPEPKTGRQELDDMEDEEIDLAKIFKEPDDADVPIPGLIPEGDIITTAEMDLTVEKGELTSEPLDFDSDDEDEGDEPPFEMDESTRFVSVGSGTAKHEQAVIDYAFPPLSLLKLDRAAKNSDISSEIQQTANKLVETLRSFNVKTKIINVSRGPTVTRYELQPEVGTKVRSILNLVDDIALHLATSGVRIEAPIPGKEAVGIEVPNRSTSTVYIRELLEDESFKSHKSKVVTALGMDVAGAPVFLDVAKMPHLLIAGTTGSGKSVCINSLIVSMLYKARPDEVKFIMVDPKKVELNVYNGIPHLLVPVVSDPKKAAGSLHWAVTEMERRYELIEGAGVRNIKGYNDSIANDPDAEKLPQIVIIIDELADLMMMARDDVEEAICRIAQKARAAGMHLVLGTQRPTVDVVTGLIKANVPSRIAFTTFSQMDSRTIIDTVGAEKLIGRGDMLYAPIGSVKPTRVQGCFVSDEEVEEVTTFIKNNYGVREYDQSVIDTIEREAQLCGNKKATVLGDGDEEANDGDPMLKPAIQLAVESGKISTSLIQRKLQLGYGRAAKLIDAMEQMGIVSPPQGQKPRDVLISKSEWMEMELRREE